MAACTGTCSELTAELQSSRPSAPCPVKPSGTQLALSDGVPNLPTVQLVQTVLRGDAAYLPAGQLSHTVAWPVSLWRWPATQLPQAVLRARAAENVPLAHMVQTVLRSSSRYLPCKHVVQSVVASVGTAVGTAAVCVA